MTNRFASLPDLAYPPKPGDLIGVTARQRLEQAGWRLDEKTGNWASPDGRSMSDWVVNHSTVDEQLATDGDVKDGR